MEQSSVDAFFGSKVVDVTDVRAVKYRRLKRFLLEFFLL